MILRTGTLERGLKSETEGLCNRPERAEKMAQSGAKLRKANPQDDALERAIKDGAKQDYEDETWRRNLLKQLQRLLALFQCLPAAAAGPPVSMNAPANVPKQQPRAEPKAEPKAEMKVNVPSGGVGKCDLRTRIQTLLITSP